MSHHDAVICRPTISRRLSTVVLVAMLVALSGCFGGGGTPTSSSTTVDKNAPPKFISSTTMAKIQRRGTFIVGLVFNQPPFSFTDPATGSLRGFDVEIAQQIAHDIFGQDIEGKISYLQVDPLNRESLLTQNRADIVLGKYLITAAAKRLVDFAGPYFASPQDIVTLADVAEGQNPIRTPIDLNGKKVCTVKNSALVGQFQQQVPQADVSTSYDLVSQCAAALQQGQVSALVADHIDLLQLYTQEGSVVQSLSGYQVSQLYGIALQRGDNTFRSFLNDQLVAMGKDNPWTTWTTAYTNTIGNDPNSPKQPDVDRY